MMMPCCLMIVHNWLILVLMFAVASACAFCPAGRFISLSSRRPYPVKSVLPSLFQPVGVPSARFDGPAPGAPPG